MRDNDKWREALVVYQRSLALLWTNAPAIYNAGILSAKFGDLNQELQYLKTFKAVNEKLAKTLLVF